MRDSLRLYLVTSQPPRNAPCRMEIRPSQRLPPFPPVISMLARFQLGFVTSLGSGRPTDSSIFHGYGQTDPSIAASGPSAVEIVSVLASTPPIKRSLAVAHRTVGDWTVDVDDTSSYERDMNEQFSRARAQMRFNVISYNLSREGSHDMTMSAKLAVISSLHDSIAKELLAAGFDQISESELRRQTGEGSEDVLRDVTKNMPFGNVGLVKFAPSFRMLLKETGLPCTRNGSGAVWAYLMGMQPTEGVQRDIGGISVLIADMGACSVSGDAQTYSRGLLHDATQEIVDALGHR